MCVCVSHVCLFVCIRVYICVCGCVFLCAFVSVCSCASVSVCSCALGSNPRQILDLHLDARVPHAVRPFYKLLRGNIDDSFYCRFMRGGGQQIWLAAKTIAFAI
jgi:hypothetical protein